MLCECYISRGRCRVIQTALIEYFLSHQAKGIHLSIQEVDTGTRISLAMDEVHLSEKAFFPDR